MLWTYLACPYRRPRCALVASGQTAERACVTSLRRRFGRICKGKSHSILAARDTAPVQSLVKAVIWTRRQAAGVGGRGQRLALGAARSKQDVGWRWR
jgi:hypothetical protein